MVGKGVTGKLKEFRMSGSVGNHDNMRKVRGGGALEGLRAISWNGKA